MFKNNSLVFVIVMICLLPTLVNAKSNGLKGLIESERQLIKILKEKIALLDEQLELEQDPKNKIAIIDEQIDFEQKLQRVEKEYCLNRKLLKKLVLKNKLQNQMKEAVEKQDKVRLAETIKKFDTNQNDMVRLSKTRQLSRVLVDFMTLEATDEPQNRDRKRVSAPVSQPSFGKILKDSLKNPVLHFGAGLVDADGTALKVYGGGPILVQPIHGRFLMTEFLAVGRVFGHGLNLAYAQYGAGPAVVALKGTVINPALGATRINLPDHTISSKISCFLNVLHGPVLAQYVYVPATNSHIFKVNFAMSLKDIAKLFKK